MDHHAYPTENPNRSLRQAMNEIDSTVPFIQALLSFVYMTNKLFPYSLFNISLKKWVELLTLVV